MIRNIKDWFVKTEKQPIALIDSCFIEGTILKHIETDKWNVKLRMTLMKGLEG